MVTNDEGLQLFCAACVPGKYEDAEEHACKSCPAKWASAGGLTYCAECKVGEVTVNGGAACQKCAPGFHTDTVDRASCKPLRAREDRGVRLRRLHDVR